MTKQTRATESPLRTPAIARSAWWYRTPPAGISHTGGVQTAADVTFLADTTWVGSDGKRRCEQEIFDAVFEMIRNARKMVLLDMFLYNNFDMHCDRPHRHLCSELTNVLLLQKQAHPDMLIVVITDPINTVYGSVPSIDFDILRDAGISVVTTDLTQLRDSNPVYSAVWRLFVRPLGNSARGILPDPFGGRGKMTLRSFLAMLNFKANHRKLIIADHDGDLVGLVTSANPHDASSAHTNVAARFRGEAVADLLRTENSVLRFCGYDTVPLPEVKGCGTDGTTVQVLTERAIKTAALELIANATEKERVDLAAFYLSDRDIVAALINARRRDVLLRILLDPNKDAFGHNKFGIPNRPVAAELHAAGLDLRWSHTHGEQCHAKMLLRSSRYGSGQLLLGSANLTRRNLDDFNLETDVLIRGSSQSPAFRDARAYFDLLWHNGSGATYSVPYEYYRDESRFRKYLYRFMEASGMCTF